MGAASERGVARERLEPLFADGKGREVPLPDLGVAKVADTHAHLDMLEDPALALARAALAGVGLVATVADVTEDAWRTYDELPSWLAQAGELLRAAGHADVTLPRVRVIVGVHPHNAKDFSDEAAGELRRLAEHPLTCAVGEIGLDYHYDHSPREVQRAVFSRALGIAHELLLPVVVHLREAHDDGAAILQDAGPSPGGSVLHCFTGSPALAERFLAMGCSVSFAGPVTFKRADAIRESARVVPPGRILTETDCPFMAPEPFRGRPCEPAHVVFTAARTAAARGEPLEAFAAHSFAAAERLFDRVRR